MFGILAIFGDVGAAIGPWFAGVVSDIALTSSRLLSIGENVGLNAEQIGLRTGLLTATIFPLILVIGIILLRKVQKNRVIG